MTLNQIKCVTYARATLSRLQVMEYKEIEGSTYGGWKTPTGFDWLELLGMTGKEYYLRGKQLLDIYSSGDIGYEDEVMQFNLATNEPATPDDWGKLSELLGL